MTDWDDDAALNAAIDQLRTALDELDPVADERVRQALGGVFRQIWRHLAHQAPREAGP